MYKEIGEPGTNGKFPVICHQCKEYIKKGRAAEEAERRRKGLEEYSLPEASWPLHSPDLAVNEDITRLRGLLAALLIAIAEPALSQGGYSGDSEHHLPAFESHSKWRRVLMSRATAAKVREFSRELQLAVDNLWKAGIAEGQNLLKQLATGRISNEEFDSVERPVRRRARGRRG